MALRYESIANANTQTLMIFDETTISQNLPNMLEIMQKNGNSLHYVICVTKTHHQKSSQFPN